MSITSNVLKEAFTVGHAVSLGVGAFGHAAYTKLKAVYAKVVAAEKVVAADVKKAL